MIFDVTVGKILWDEMKNNIALRQDLSKHEQCENQMKSVNTIYQSYNKIIDKTFATLHYEHL